MRPRLGRWVRSRPREEGWGEAAARTVGEVAARTVGAVAARTVGGAAAQTGKEGSMMGEGRNAEAAAATAAPAGTHTWPHDRCTGQAPPCGSPTPTTHTPLVRPPSLRARGARGEGQTAGDARDGPARPARGSERGGRGGSKRADPTNARLMEHTTLTRGEKGAARRGIPGGQIAPRIET